MSKKLKLLLNIGSVDANKLGLSETLEGKTVTVNDDVAAVLIKNGWATTPGSDAPLTGGPATPLHDTTTSIESEAGGEEESPVSDTNASEAIDAIDRMRSKDRLQHIIDNDQRATVKDAARKRLASLG